MELDKIKYLKVGTHRRIPFQAIMEYKQTIDSQRHKVLDEFTAEAQELRTRY
jgi:hypothetical protein